MAAPTSLNGTPAPTETLPEVAVRLGLTADELKRLNSAADLIKLLSERNVKVRSVMDTLRYEEELESLQVEMVHLQRWIQAKGLRVAVLFEGRYAEYVERTSPFVPRPPKR